MTFLVANSGNFNVTNSFVETFRTMTILLTVLLSVWVVSAIVAHITQKGLFKRIVEIIIVVIVIILLWLCSNELWGTTH